MTRDQLQRVRDWADGKLASGEEPPWAWHQYMKLRESIDAILAATGHTLPQAESSPRREPPLRLVAADHPRRIAQRHLS